MKCANLLSMSEKEKRAEKRSELSAPNYCSLYQGLSLL